MTLYGRECFNCIELKDSDVISLSPDEQKSR